MRVLVVGSDRNDLPADKKKLIHDAGFDIGAQLARRGHRVLVGSEDASDVDPDVVRGALSANANGTVEVHRMDGSGECYAANSNIKNRMHRYQDWDVTVLEVLRGEADAVIALGGRTGVVQTGVSAWMMGKAVLPIASFDGGARKIWEYGSGERREFYFGALNDEEIDRLKTSWDRAGKGTSAEFVVDALERIERGARRTRSGKLFLIVSFLTLMALVAWVFLLAAPLIGIFQDLLTSWYGAGFAARLPNALFVLLFISVCVAGSLGALMQTLRGMREDRPTTWRNVVIDLVLGTAAGFLSAALYLIAQIAITGRLELPSSDTDYVRAALIVGLAALFSSLSLDAALARFDTVRESVVTGKYESGSKAPKT